MELGIFEAFLLAGKHSFGQRWRGKVYNRGMLTGKAMACIYSYPPENRDLGTQPWACSACSKSILFNFLRRCLVVKRTLSQREYL